MSDSLLMRVYEEAHQEKRQKPKPTLDAADGGSASVAQAAAMYTAKDIAVKAVTAIQQLCETDDLDDNEGLGDRLMALFIGIADMNKDGDISDDEQAVIDIAIGAAGEYLSSKGVSDDDIEALLNDFDNEVADRVCDFLKGTLPDGDDAAMDDIDAFAFSDGDQDAVFDAVYKKRLSLVGGVKKWVKKRISGTVKLSAKRKLAIQKMLRKSHSSAAQAKRLKAFHKQRKMGLQGK